MGHLLVRSHEQITTIRQRCETRRAARDHDEPMTFQLKVADDFRTEQTVDITGSRDFEPGPEFLGDDAAADEFAAFEDKDFSASARQIGGSDEAVMTRTDDDG